ATIKKLKNILERFDYRLNPVVHIPLNTFLLWDLHQMMMLEKWKADNKQNISAWFNALANIEALISIATLSFNHPNWSFPVLSNEESVFVADDLGHPLIAPEKCVTNSFSTTGEKQLNLITGSNMAGKSTFLRSIGVNMVFAMMGAPTCSSQLKVSPMKVISSMRVNDNLEENTSTFYAELKKLKEIIDAVNNKEKVFLLLDEILRGTNSADRHTGSIALIKQLLRQNASGLIATHDLELAKLSDEFPASLHNYHFDVQVKGEELYFDYKIKKGICTSMNASLLMKKIGIDL
ncbi:MAG: DNA mismatch repair protein MutS, partial [Bacteroidia bacterium]|nr:DNA mismatch repair protein MutS [Bacteroidia bacterium]